MAEPKVKTLFPRKDTIEEAEQHIRAQLPITNQNELTAALALYHNTMLHQIQTIARSQYGHELGPTTADCRRPG